MCTSRIAKLFNRFQTNYYRTQADIITSAAHRKQRDNGKFMFWTHPIN